MLRLPYGSNNKSGKQVSQRRVAIAVEAADGRPELDGAQMIELMLGLREERRGHRREFRLVSRRPER